MAEQTAIQFDCYTPALSISAGDSHFNLFCWTPKKGPRGLGKWEGGGVCWFSLTDGGKPGNLELPHSNISVCEGAQDSHTRSLVAVTPPSLWGSRRGWCFRGLLRKPSRRGSPSLTCRASRKPWMTRYEPLFLAVPLVGPTAAVDLNLLSSVQSPLVAV